MGVKRGLFISLVFLILFAVAALGFAPGPLGERDSGYQSRVQESSIFTDENSNSYTYALGVGEADDDLECDTDSLHNLHFGILEQERTGNNLTVRYPNAGRCYPHTGGREWFDSGGECQWADLPLNRINGCYFFSSESDYEFDDECRHSDDCAGWFVREGSIVNADPLTATTRFFGENPSAPAGFQWLLDGGPSTYLVQGDVSENYEEDTNPICLFNHAIFNSPSTTFQCIRHENEYRWYICDEEHLSSATGIYIPIERGPFACDDPTNPCTEGTCSQGFCVDDAGNQIGTGEAEGLFCTLQDNQYAWVERPLRCSDPGVECDEDETICEQGFYNWMDMAGGNSCCGNDGLADLATTGTTSNGNEYICLHKNNENLVGYVEGSEGSQQITAEPSCRGDWCWFSAFANSLHVFTIKKPGELPYDIVSDSQQWLSCDNTYGERALEPEGILFDQDTGTDLEAEARRFYCYQEGLHWSWAECIGENRNMYNTNTIKGRHKGEGLYSLYLTDIDETNPYGIRYSGPLSRIDITPRDGSFETFYGSNGFDFSGYDYLEFFVRFVADEQGTPISHLNPEFDVPANIFVIIYGPGDVIYFNQAVLGYTTNNPLFSDDNWMHVKIPIGNFIGVQGIRIESVPETNQIGVKNVYLTREGETPQFCSGQQGGTSSWINDLDQSIEGHTISGEELCKSHFGENAWLGNYDEVTSETASCCGNNDAEYYSGPSANGFGCWNSQPIESGNMTMNVEFTVEYQQLTTSVAYQDAVDAIYTIKGLYGFTHSEICSPSGCENTALPAPEGLQTTHTVIEAVGETVSAIDILQNNYLHGPVDTSGYIYYNYTIGYPNTTIYHYTLTEIELDFIGSTYSSIDRYADLYFFDLDTGEEYEIIPTNARGDNFFVRSRYIPNRLINAPTRPLMTSTQPSSSASERITYPCNQDVGECFYPLPGFPPYHITNPHPELYELYFVTGSRPADQELITNDPAQVFEEAGNIMAKKVAQQVLFLNEETDDDVIQGFFGCNAGDFVGGDIGRNADYENVPYCTIKGNSQKFCSYSVNHELQGSKFTTISSWSDEPVTEVGYAGVTDISDNIDDFYANEPLQLRPFPLPHETGITKRNFTSPVLPARNIIPNAAFKDTSQGIPHWEVRNLRAGRQIHQVAAPDGTATLQAGEVLRSERIAVPQNAVLHFSQNMTCDTTTITLVDRNGNATQPDDFGAIETGDGVYLIIEFTGHCSVYQPMLQVVDDVGPTSYYEITRLNDNSDDARAGIACCPQNYCWNGYACVAPMTEFTYTYMAEHIEEGRDYRCVDGNWEYLPVQHDWNEQGWGFCQTEEQCFVTQEGNSENSAEDFYAENYPNCINDGEYIFDNYCNDGNWTSRTKFIAQKLLEVAGEEYLLYCTDYRDALISTQNTGGDRDQPFLGGPEGPFVLQEQQRLDAPPGEAEEVFNCFPFSAGSVGDILIGREDNTCINNVCVLRKANGDTSFATTLNKELDSVHSFLGAFDVPSDSRSSVCPDAGTFARCDLSGLDIEGDLWYSSDLQAVVYSKDGINLNPGILQTFWQDVWNALLSLFGAGSDLADEEQFVEEAVNSRWLYLLQGAGKEVRATQETLPGKQTLIAEYENFDTPICEYIRHITPPPDQALELLQQVTGREKLSCSIRNETQRIEMVAGLDFFWPMLTGQLRVG